MKHEDVERYGLTARGKAELLKYLEGGRLTRKEAMLAKCFECCNGYADGKADCGIESCPIYPYMPFSTRKITSGRKLTPEQRVEVGKRLKKARRHVFKETEKQRQNN
ncbi:MAG: hypothetical protein JRD43_00480 [Deltaproteobacteria bacterium]|nr:hypothetical protein [Deltaproteobacteria bacterium]